MAAEESEGRHPARGLVVIFVFLALAAGLILSAVGTRSGTAERDAAGSAPLGGLPNDPTLGFVEIPAGPFRMGSDPRVDPLAFENEFWQPGGGQGIVDLPTFWIGRTEVTTEQFRAFVESADHPVPDSLTLSTDGNVPITHVSWPDALAYGRWLTSMLRSSDRTPAALKALLDNGWTVTLPTEAQWEKAARGTEGWVYPWGNEARRDLANYRSTGPRPVGSVACFECVYGLADMAGNVWEWTRSPYEPYPFDSSTSIDLAADALWIMRGGGFSDNDQTVRAATRGGADPGARRPFIGFRVVISPPNS